MRRTTAPCRNVVSRSPGPALPYMRVDSGRGQNRTLRLLLAFWPPVFAGEQSVFVRSSDQVGRAAQPVKQLNLPYTVLDDEMEATEDRLAIGTMHLAKGLEFRAVAVVACDSEVIPLQSRVESIAYEADLEEVYNTERNLLYVACTRARDHLLVTGVEPASEFLDDLRM